MIEYTNLIQSILTNGTLSTTRTGIDTIRTFYNSIEFNLQNGFPIITCRNIPYKLALAELSAFLHKCTTSAEFNNIGCPFWNNYGDNLGPIYGYQWLDFNGINQLDELITNIKTQPFSRRLVLSTWNVNQLSDMVLPPCHLYSQYFVESNNLDCIVYMRSSDILLGLPSDIIVYATLQHLISIECNLTPRRLIFILADTHIYTNQINCAKEILKRKPLPLPSIQFNRYSSITDFIPSDVEILNYNPHPSIKIPYNL